MNAERAQIPLALKSTEQNIMHFHELLCHPNEELTRATAKQHSINLNGDRVPSPTAHKVSVTKPTGTRSRVRLGRIFVDFSRTRSVPSFGCNNHVMIFVDDYTRKR